MDDADANANADRSLVEELSSTRASHDEYPLTAPMGKAALGEGQLMAA